MTELNVIIYIELLSVLFGVYTHTGATEFRAFRSILCNAWSNERRKSSFFSDLTMFLFPDF